MVSVTRKTIQTKEKGNLLEELIESKVRYETIFYFRIGTKMDRREQRQAFCRLSNFIVAL